MIIISIIKIYSAKYNKEIHEVVKETMEATFLWQNTPKQEAVAIFTILAEFSFQSSFGFRAKIDWKIKYSIFECNSLLHKKHPPQSIFLTTVTHLFQSMAPQ